MNYDKVTSTTIKKQSMFKFYKVMVYLIKTRNVRIK